MKCAWKELLAILPPQIQKEVDSLGPSCLQELRIRQNCTVEAVMDPGSRFLCGRVDDLSGILNLASRYSPWAQQTLANGYLTIPGGHRIGVCGECIVNNGQVSGMRKVTSLCIRIAKDIQGIAEGIQTEDSVLILGPPGYGKTTLLRDLIRKISAGKNGYIAVVDERGELFPVEGGFDTGPRTDVLSLCPKPKGIMRVLKTMGPRYIAVDEITAKEDCDALLESARCGVRLVATAHARDAEDLARRGIYKPLLDTGVFNTCIVLQADKLWRKERIMP